MARKDMPKVRHTTDVVTLGWPHLHAPDTRFAKDGDRARYKTEFTASAEESQVIRGKAKEIIKDARSKKLVKAPVDLPGTKNDDGTYTFRCHTYSRPALFDAAGTPLNSAPKVGGGTLAKIALLLQVYEGFGKTGATIYCNAFQIIELKEFGGDAASFGFESTEGFAGSDDEDFDDEDPFEGDDEESDDTDEEADF